MKITINHLLLVTLCTLSFTLFAGEKEKIQVTPEKQFVLDWLSQPDVLEKYGKISDAIWSYAELGLQEFKSSELLAVTLEQEGFEVERGLAGMPTCFVATYGSGKPVIGILCEYDALPMISQKAMVTEQAPLVEGAPGHGCGHNAMGTASVSGAIAIKKAMERFGIGGTVKVFGSPAEEMLLSRPYMVRTGLFEGVDAAIDNHGSGGLWIKQGVTGSALYSVLFTFKGKTAHSGGAPWAGRSALDAVEIMNVATNYLREHLHYSYRMHYVITEGGEAPNVVPDRATVWYFLRNSDERIEDMYERVSNCAKGAALATGTEVETRVLTAIHQKHSNTAATELYHKNMELVGLPEWTEEEQNFAKSLQKKLGRTEKGLNTEVAPLIPPEKSFTGGASTDVGEVSLVTPTATIYFPSSVPGVTGHHWSTVTCGKGSIAWKGLNAAAKVIAASAIDLLTKPEELKKLRDEFQAYSQEHPYKSLLPEDAVPPLDINKELMNKYRPLMEEYYTEPD